MSQIASAEVSDDTLKTNPRERRLMRLRALRMYLVAIVLSAVLLVLAMPLGEQFYLAWFALVPLLIVSHGKGVIIGFIAALAVIFLAALFAASGVFYGHRFYGGTASWLYTDFGLYGFAVALTVGCWADTSLCKKPAWWFASLAVLLEAVLLIQLPANLALTQYRQPLMMVVASVGGIWLVSWLVWWASLTLARLQVKKAFVRSLVVGVASLVLSWLPIRAGGPTMLVGAVQVPSDDPPMIVAYHRQASINGAKLAVWTESGGIGMARGSNTESLTRLSRRAPIVTSFEDMALPKPHNVAALFADQKESARYFKRKLFGGEAKDHAPGDEAVAVPFAGGQLGLNICFDSCFPSIIRETAMITGVNLIALPTIDPESPHYFNAAMHAAFTPFRAAESGVPIIRADGYAYSMVVDNLGHVIARADPGSKLMMANVPLGSRFTIAKLLGDWVLYICGALFLLGFWRSRKPIP